MFAPDGFRVACRRVFGLADIPRQYARLMPEEHLSKALATPSSSPSLAAGCSDLREPVNATLLDPLARSDQWGGQGWIATHGGELVDEAREGETISR